VKIIGYISKFMLYLTMIVMVVMMLLTVADVFMRFVFNNPLTGTVELTEFLMVCMALGMAVAALEGRHIKLDIVTMRLSRRARTIMEIITILSGTWLIFFLAWTGVVTGIADINYKSQVLELSELPFRVILAAGFGTLFLAMLSLILQKIMELLKR